jgi:large subunit ribosomal protein L24
MKKLRSGDDVIVIAGKNKGSRGKILKVLVDGRAIVSGVNMMKKHQKPNPNLQIAGGIVEKEAPIDASNLAIWNNETSKADRVGFQIIDGQKKRIFKSNGKTIES